MVSFERESRWIHVNGILPESLGESNSRIRVQLLTLGWVHWTSIKIEAKVHYFVIILEHKVNMQLLI